MKKITCEEFLDMWVEAKRNGYAGDLERIKLPDGSKMVIYGDRSSWIYIDRWYGSDLGGGQEILWMLEKPYDLNSRNPAHPVGTPICRMSYSGRVVRRFSKEEIKELSPVFGGTKAERYQSDILWEILKLALSQVTKERPFRGPEYFPHPLTPKLVYTSHDIIGLPPIRVVGSESILFNNIQCFEGVYDFIIIKKDFEDKLFSGEARKK